MGALERLRSIDTTENDAKKKKSVEERIAAAKKKAADAEQQTAQPALPEKHKTGAPAIADAPASAYGGVFDVDPDSFVTDPTGEAKPSAARNAVLSGLAGTGSSLSKNTSLLLGGMAQGREDAAEHITTPAWLTKGSIYANRGYDPMNPERSEQETRNLQAASTLANEMARDLRAKEQMLDAQAKENLGAVGTAAYDLTKMGTQIVGDAVANRLLPGSGLLSMGQRSFGQGVMAAEDEGITGTRAIAYGAGTAAIEMATEKISAIAKPLKAIYGKGLVDDMIQNLTKTAKGNRVLSVLGSAAGEGAEEAIASVLQVPLQNITLQNGAAYDAQWLADTAYEALLGGLMGGAFGVASIPGEIAQERRNNAVQRLAEEMARESMQNATQSAPAQMQAAENAQMPAENKMAQSAIQTAKSASVEDAASQFGEAGAQVYKAGYRDTGDDAQYFGDFYKAYQAGMRGEAAPKSSLTDTETAAAHAAGVSDAKRSAQAAYFGKDSQLVRDDKWKRAHLSTKDSRKLDALAKVLGVKIRFVDSVDETVQNELGETEIRKSVADAQYGNGEILLALDAENPVMVSVVHEAVHRLRETTPAEYASLVQFVQNNMSSGALNWAVKRRGANYKGADRTGLTEEVVADAFGQLINDTALLDQFVKDNRTAAEKLLDYIRDMINDIKRALNKQNLQLTAEQRKEFQELHDNLYEAEKLLGNALNVSAETVEKRGAQEYTGDKETKHSRKDSANNGTEENRRHAVEVFRGVGTLEWSQINKEKRVAYERRSAFAGRIAKAGAVEKTVGNVLYGYRPVPVSAASKYAREVIEELRKFGINDAFVFEGEVQANHLGKTISDAAECMTLLDGAIGIKDEAKMDAKNVAAHEAIHYKKKKGETAAVDYEEAVISNVDLSSDLFQKYYDAINDTYFSGGLNWGNQKDVAKFVDEFSAYVGGHLYSGIFDVSEMFVDMANVIPALEKALGVPLNIQSDTTNEQLELSDVNVKFSAGEYGDEASESALYSRKGMSIEEYIEKYGPIPAGEKPYREVSVPRKTGEKEKVSQTVRTVMEAEATPDEMIPTIEELVADGEFSYESYSDKRAIEVATKTIQKDEFAPTLANWLSEIKNGKVNKRNTTLGWVLYNNCANSGDTKSAMTILTAMVEHQRNAAQALQATRILKKMSPAGQLYGVQRSISNLQSELREKFGDKAPNLTISKYLADKFMDAKTQKERDEIMTEIYKDIGRQMPNSFMDKWRAWRYLAMLGNPRTHVRNIVGNAGFAPMVWTKDLVATGIEAVAGKASGGKMGRTKALPSAELISAAAADFPNAQKKILEGGKYNESEINDAIEEGRVIFKTRVLEKARVGNRKLMEQEDLWFSKGHYAIALAQYCKANSISAQHIRSGKLSDHARAYAIKEAQKATYRDTNAFSEFVSNMGRYHGNNPVGKAGSLLVEGVLPFRKTPANILVRGLEYSPAGFLKGLTWDLWMVRKHAKNPDEGITAAEAIDHISAGFVGTQMVALGAFGAMMGVLRGRGGDDEDQKKFDELQGHQAYSLELEAIDTSVTLDWLAPEVLPLFIGVNIAEEAMRSKEDLTMSDLMAAIGNVTAPMLTMSCLSGLNELFESVSYATNEGIAALPKIAMSAATSLITQAIPTLAGQIERTAQENGRMTTYTDKNNRWLTPDMQYSIGRASSRTPGWDFNQIPYIDAWGRQEVDTNRWARGLNNFLNPAYVSKIEGGAMEEELQRLYDATGEAKVLPDRADKHFKVNGKEKYLTASEYVKYATAKGQKSYDLLTKMTKLPSWKALSDEEKVKAISQTYEYANALAKQRVSSYKIDGTNAKILQSKNEAVYILAYAAQTGINEGLQKNGETIENTRGLLRMEAMYALPAIADMDANKRKELFLSIGVGKEVAGYSEEKVAKELKAFRKIAD